MQDDESDTWPDPGGPEPDDAAWLTPQTGWTWDADSLMMGEYVGYPLYLRLRDRLQSLRLPSSTHNQLIQAMIDTHDVGVFDHGVARSTLIVKMKHDEQFNVHDIEIHDASEFATLSGLMQAGSHVSGTVPAGHDSWRRSRCVKGGIYRHTLVAVVEISKTSPFPHTKKGSYRHFYYCQKLVG